MTAQKGKLVLLKADLTGDSPQVFTTIAGLRTTTWTVNGEDVDVTTKDDNGWQQRLSGAGVRSLSVSASGIFQDTAGEETIRQWAFDQSINLFQITFENGDQLECRFQISNYERTGDHDGAETYLLTLSSDGTPVYTAA
jgi:TP901-1 family phage major tail protein